VDPFLIGIASIVLFFAWAGWKLRGRDNLSGPDARGDRHSSVEHSLIGRPNKWRRE